MLLQLCFCKAQPRLGSQREMQEEYAREPAAPRPRPLPCPGSCTNLPLHKPSGRQLAAKKLEKLHFQLP